MPEVSVKGKGKGKKTLESVRIGKAANGFSVRCSYAYSGNPSGRPMAYTPDKEHVFNDLGATLAFVKKELGG